MAINFGAITANALRTASTVGVAGIATITRPLPAPDPLTGAQSGAPVSQTVDVVQQDATQLARRNAAWSTASVALFAAAAPLTFAPRAGDTATFGGRTVRVTVVEEFAPTGAVIGYFIGGGA